VSPLQRSVRYYMGLPRRRDASVSTIEWLELSDGVRLATHVIRPARAGAEPSPVILMRTPLPTGRRMNPARIFARLLAEDGFNVVLQECRGRYDSEGSFEHFRHEAQDGAETVAWIAAQPWGVGPLALLGFGYAGYAAWAALSRAPERVAALVVGFQGRDPYASLHAGGALRLEAALRLGVGIGENAVAPKRNLDLERGCEHRPVREADRVARRRVDSYREWIAHPRRDDYWRALAPEIPSPPPAALLIGGWYDPSIGPMLADYAELRRSAARCGTTAPELAIGPWLGGRAVRDARGPRGGRQRRFNLRSVSSFLERSLRGSAQRTARVSVFVNGADCWREFPEWPPPEPAEQVFYLRSRGRANGLRGNGELVPDPPGDGFEPDRYSCDPDDPVRSVAVALRGGRDAAGQRSLEGRDDVLCYTTAPLVEAIDVLGPARLVLFAASSAPDCDFSARLVDVAPGGIAVNRGEVYVRARWQTDGADPVWFEGDTPRCFELEFDSICSRFPAGHRLRLEVASANFPRFDRNPHSRDGPEDALPERFGPARQTLHHDASHPSRLVLRTAPGRSAR
jgi:putative CocE/NonD family hydrolase